MELPIVAEAVGAETTQQPASPSSTDIRAVEDYFRRTGLPELSAEHVSSNKWVLEGITEAWFRVASVLGIAIFAVIIVTAFVPLPRWLELTFLVVAGFLILTPIAPVLELLPTLPIHLGRGLAAGFLSAPGIAAAMPAMVAVVAFLFLTHDVWRVFGTMALWRVGVVVWLLMLIACLMLWRRFQPDLRKLAAPERGLALSSLAGATPARVLVEQGFLPPTPLPKLSRRARLNLSVLLVLSLVARLFAAAVALGAVFAAFGALVIDRALTEEWAGNRAVWGRDFVVSAALLKVAALLAALAASYFAAISLDSERRRQRFAGAELSRMSSAIAAWAYYRGALDDLHSATARDQTAQVSDQTSEEDAARGANRTQTDHARDRP